MMDFLDWAAEVMPEVFHTQKDLAGGIGADLSEMKTRQERYSTYLGRVGELHAVAKAYYLSAVAVATEIRAVKFSPSLIGKLIGKDCNQELRVYEQIKNLHATLSELLISIASRLKHEGSVFIPYDIPNRPQDRK